MDIISVFEQGMARQVPRMVGFLDAPVLNIGCGNKEIPGTTGLDLPGWDADKDRIPFLDNYCGGIIAYHFLEHCADPIRVLREFERVLKPGAPANIVVPYYNSFLQAQDLTHKHAFNEETWRNLFKNHYYTPDKVCLGPWRFEIGTNLIMGVVERNLCLLTQLIKR